MWKDKQASFDFAMQELRKQKTKYPNKLDKALQLLKVEWEKNWWSASHKNEILILMEMWKDFDNRVDCYSLLGGAEEDCTVYQKKLIDIIMGKAYLVNR